MISVGRWVIGLGILRLAIAAGGSFMGLTLGPPGSISPTLIDSIRFLADVWLIGLGVLLIRTRWPECLRVVSMMLLTLSILSVLSALAAWLLFRNSTLVLGSFQIARSELEPLTLRGVFLALAGSIQIVLEVAVAIRSLLLARSIRESSIDSTSTGPATVGSISTGRRVFLTRFVWTISVLLTIGSTHLPTTPSSFQEFLASTPLIRDLLVGEDRKVRRRHFQSPQTPEEIEQERDVQRLVNEAARLWSSKDYQEASEAYDKALDICESSKAFEDPQGRSNIALLKNNFAWLLVTRPDRSPADGKKALELAKDALSVNSMDGSLWNTVAAANYRTEKWQAAKDALLRSMEIRADGDGYDWILMALVYAKMGRIEHAKEWYEKAAKWRLDARAWDEELYRFEVEAAQLLELPDPKPPVRRRYFFGLDDHRDSFFTGRGGHPIVPRVGDPGHHRRSER
jgi:tetratricopeptide (TPR) repeat protein